MDDMIELMDANGLLRRRLEAYADIRLSPDLATSSRLRARVLAVAHRQASLARADAALTVISPNAVAGEYAAGELARDGRRNPVRTGSRRWSRAAGAFLAASLATAIVVGGVSAGQAGGPLYETRLWVETLTLPGDPSARAVAELSRLRDRLREAGEADRAGDIAGTMAALGAYEAILEQASASAIAAGDDVAAAVLETGVGRNVEVLRALAARVPTTAGAAITRAVDAAIARSTDAVERISASRPGGGGDDGAGPDSPATPPRATKAPTAEPTPEPDSTATPKPKPTKNPTPTPAATPTATDDPTEPPGPAATPEPRRTPDRTPKPRNDRPEPPDGPPGNSSPGEGD